MSERIVDGEDAMSVLSSDKFRRHGKSAINGVFIAARWAKAAFASKRNKFEIATFFASPHYASVTGIATMEHFINVFNNRRTRMKRIKDFFVMVCKNFLKDIHMSIMSNKAKKNNTPS
jgi:hypothetical protein